MGCPLISDVTLSQKRAEIVFSSCFINSMRCLEITILLIYHFLQDFDGFFGGFLGPQDKHPYRPFKRNFGNNKEVASMTVETGCVSDDPIEEAEAMFGEEFVEKKWNSIFVCLF